MLPYHAIFKRCEFKESIRSHEKASQCKIEIPIVFMMYYNTILHYGVEAFVDACIKSGVDGLIIPDLPLEEQDEIKRIFTEGKCTDSYPTGISGFERQNP